MLFVIFARGIYYYMNVQTVNWIVSKLTYNSEARPRLVEVLKHKKKINKQNCDNRVFRIFW